MNIAQAIILAVMFFGAAYLGYTLGRASLPRCYFCGEEAPARIRVGNHLASVEICSCDQHHEPAAALAQKEGQEVLRLLFKAAKVERSVQ